MDHETFTRRAGVRALAFLALLFLTDAAPDAGATFRVWQGTNGVQWSAPGNWSPAGPPQNGDDLHFPNAAANLTSSNDIAGLALTSILINAPMYLRGLTVTVTNGISSSVLALGSVTIEFPVVLRGDQ